MGRVVAALGHFLFRGESRKQLSIYEYGIVRLSQSEVTTITSPRTPCSSLRPLFRVFLKYINVFIWLHLVLVVACRVIVSQGSFIQNSRISLRWACGHTPAGYIRLVAFCVVIP